MLRKALASLAVSLMLTAVALAETKTVVLTDGRRVTGDVIETDRGYEIRTRLGAIQVARHEVVEIIVDRTPVDDFNDRLAALDADDADGHLALGQWAAEQELLELAIQQYEYVLALRPNDDKAKLLLRDVRAQLAEAAEPDPEPGQTDPDTTPGGEVAGNGEAPPIDSPPGINPDDLVTLQQIYRIRLAELRLAEIPNISFRFSNDVVARFSAAWEGKDDFDPQTFRRLRNHEKLQFILEEIGDAERHNDIRDDIQILEDPEFMVIFRTKIWRIMRQPGGCASLPSHGGMDAPGGLRFINPMSLSPGDPITVRVMYTNFLVLDRYQTEEGLRLVDRDQPEDSLLLQYGLPGELAKYKHPLIGERPIQPIFKDKADRGYVDTLNWIRTTLRGPVHPDYRVSFTPPGASGGADAPEESEVEAEGEGEGEADSDVVLPDVPGELPGEAEDEVNAIVEDAAEAAAP